jgi:ubiquinone/menaquinone biosynthesis C-methylase UbiE
VVDSAHDPAYLSGRQYCDDRNLRARQALHEHYSTSTVRWSHWFFDQIAWLVPASASLLEVGAGTGSLWAQGGDRLPALGRLVITDVSPGMLDIAERQLTGAGIRAQFDIVDAQVLPYEAAAFDGVIADHMLYHVPDRAKALSEIARVLRPDGWLAAATNGEHHMRELDELVAQFIDPDAVLPSLPFSLENGTDQLREWFVRVDLRRLPPPHDLEVTESQPIVDYIRSRPGGNRLDDDRADQLRSFVDERIATDGYFRVQTDTGVFLAFQH